MKKIKRPGLCYCSHFNSVPWRPAIKGSLDLESVCPVVSESTSASSHLVAKGAILVTESAALVVVTDCCSQYE